MQSTGLSAVTAYTAHREWATRPPDERFASVSALYEAARTRRMRTEERIAETHEIRTDAETDDALMLRDASGQMSALTHWTFEQIAAIAGAPPKYLRTLPAPIASSDQCWAAAAEPRSASTLRGSGRTVDRSGDHLVEVRYRLAHQQRGPHTAAASGRLEGR
jgi:hypothetical protein